ncbi:hypothetical protein [Yinghuangia seranimata]|uniref:hypothetical protein n=1 Tax=Yinghuangia seranimata TaxID=408067 RepID=UPI00248B0FB7|nr:hypothetical protein [Yinghuangia seranimata]MDI2128261.1 hypothetical protein [Yinghuangia seranimata]
MPGRPVSDPHLLTGRTPGDGRSFQVHPEMLQPAAARAEDAADLMLGLSFGLAVAPHTGPLGLRTERAASDIAEAWGREIGAISAAATACAEKIRLTMRAYLEAEARNTADAR